MQELPVTEARAEFSELISRVAYGGEPVIITRHGKPLVALVPAAYVVEDPGERVEGHDQSGGSISVLDVTARSGDRADLLTVAASHREDPTAH